ncbi:MAG: asparagine synthase (glutamine-hydrolyzing) [Candidatus Omnitrophota bacterium]
MCGIVGVGEFSRNRPCIQVAWVHRMAELLKHRGPDDEGYVALDTRERTVEAFVGRDSAVSGTFIDTFRGCANLFFGHRRLSILDPSPSGHQPMASGDGNVWVVFNGEIYNYIELRDELRRMGYGFHTETDTEVLLAAYQQWGEDCLNRFDGMWAFVLYDRNRNVLFGSRDRFGVKPMYYYRDGEYFAFASEIKALLSLPFIEKTINPEAVFDFLVFDSVNLGDEGFFKGIYELQPSQAFRYNCNSRAFETWNYYTLPVETRWKRFHPAKSDAYVQGVREWVMDAVRFHLRSDVPVGSALSGGIDSSSVVCVAGRLMNGGERHCVFTAGFPGLAVDESQWAKMAADHVHAQWCLTVPQCSEFMEDMEDIAYVQDIPFGSPSVYAQYRVMKLAAENGVKVLLDGQGADELFTGYTMYYPVFFQQMAVHFNFGLLRNEWRQLDHAPVERQRLVSDWGKQVRRSVVPYRVILNHRMKRKAHHRLINGDFWETYKQRFDLIRVRDFTSVNVMLAEYFTRQKLGNLLRYEDRNSMRFSVEARTPFADSLPLIEYVFGIPAAYKIHDGWSKYLLREAMRGIIPDGIRLRTDKKGFFIPDIEWLNGLKNRFHDLDCLSDVVDVPYLMTQLNEDARALTYDAVQLVWRVMSLGAWKRAFGV